MSYLDISNPLWQLLSSVIADEGLKLYDAELLSPRALRISIASNVSENGSSEEGADESNTNRGVSVGDCSRVLRRLMVVLQAEGHLFGLVPEPEIDVSSPGINRVLRLPEHFAQALGERVKVVLQPSREAEIEAGKKTALLLGQLEECGEGKLTVADEFSKSRVSVALADVKRANVEFQFA